MAGVRQGGLAGPPLQRVGSLLTQRGVAFGRRAASCCRTGRCCAGSRAEALRDAGGVLRPQPRSAGHGRAADQLLVRRRSRRPQMSPSACARHEIGLDSRFVGLSPDGLIRHPTRFATLPSCSERRGGGAVAGIGRVGRGGLRYWAGSSGLAAVRATEVVGGAQTLGDGRPRPRRTHPSEVVQEGRYLARCQPGAVHLESERDTCIALPGTQRCVQAAEFRL